MSEDIRLEVVRPDADAGGAEEIAALLASVGLSLDADIEFFVTARNRGRLVGCLGLAGSIIKGAAIDPGMQGANLVGRMLVELRYEALALGRNHLFVFTKPEFADRFSSTGFHLLAEVPGLAVLMEDDPQGLRSYAAGLAAEAAERGWPTTGRIAAIVMNANPFTRGHQYLIRTAVAQADFLHVFVVGEDVSEFSYAERFELVRAGVAELAERERIAVHPGSPYIVSRASFPQYFLKDAADVASAATGIDLQMFRGSIAPALGITHRWVGTEPASAITARYNEEMDYWLQRAPMDAPPIELHVIERTEVPGSGFISATKVRRLIKEGDLAAIEPLVPAPTFALIMRKHGEQPSSDAHSPRAQEE